MLLVGFQSDKIYYSEIVYHCHLYLMKHKTACTSLIHKWANFSIKLTHLPPCFSSKIVPYSFPSLSPPIHPSPVPLVSGVRIQHRFLPVYHVIDRSPPLRSATSPESGRGTVGDRLLITTVSSIQSIVPFWALPPQNWTLSHGGAQRRYQGAPAINCNYF